MVHFKSINHLTCSLGEREAYFKSLEIPLDTPHVLLQTCNRIELYWGEGELSKEIARHLFRVVSGLESGLLGESAIQGQVKTAYELAKSEQKLSPALHRLFQMALRVGKLVRTQSGIGRGAVSHGQATVELIQQSNINMKQALITLIGVNKLTEDTIRFLQNKGAETLFVANRSFEKAKPYADKYNCQIFDFTNLKEILSNTDILISATSAPHTVIKKEQFPANKEMLIFDLAFPRDVDAEIAHFPDVQLFNLDSLEQIIGQSLNNRVKEMAIAESIIEEETIKMFGLWRMNKALTKAYSYT
jgi:glutamyl-tRNA reductase